MRRYVGLVAELTRFDIAATAGAARAAVTARAG